MRHYVERARPRSPTRNGGVSTPPASNASASRGPARKRAARATTMRCVGPFMIEYDNTQNDANRIHSVWRDFTNDWGEDLLAAHYAAHAPDDDQDDHRGLACRLARRASLRARRFIGRSTASRRLVDLLEMQPRHRVLHLLDPSAVLRPHDSLGPLDEPIHVPSEHLLVGTPPEQSTKGRRQVRRPSRQRMPLPRSPQGGRGPHQVRARHTGSR